MKDRLGRLAAKIPQSRPAGFLFAIPFTEACNFGTAKFFR